MLRILVVDFVYPEAFLLVESCACFCMRVCVCVCMCVCVVCVCVCVCVVCMCVCIFLFLFAMFSHFMVNAAKYISKTITNLSTTSENEN